MIQIKIEIPKGSNIKYEFNKKTETMEVDRILNVKYPFNYGFIPGTLWDDGDPLDVVLVGDFSLHPGVELKVEPIALVKMYDNGVSDWKIVCAFQDEIFSDYKNIILKFLKTYKKGVKIEDVTIDKTEITLAITDARCIYNFDSLYPPGSRRRK